MVAALAVVAVTVEAALHWYELWLNMELLDEHEMIRSHL